MKLKVAIVEDDPAWRDLLAALLKSSGKYELVGVYATGDEAIKDLPKRQPHLVLMDLVLPGMSGLECTRKLRALIPGLEVLVITGVVQQDQLPAALQAGASGYLQKPFEFAECLQAIDQVAAGMAYLTPAGAKLLVRMLSEDRAGQATQYGLTPRELQILSYAGTGLGNKQIAPIIGVSEATVHNHLQHAYAKLGVHSKTEAISKLRQSPPPGALPLPSACSIPA